MEGRLGDRRGGETLRGCRSRSSLLKLLSGCAPRCLPGDIMLAPRVSDDVQSQGTSYSGDSSRIGEDRYKHFAVILSASTLDEVDHSAKTGLIGDQSGIPAFSGIQVTGLLQLNSTSSKVAAEPTATSNKDPDTRFAHLTQQEVPRCHINRFFPLKYAILDRGITS
ncbi:uncharacterized protein ARMOST_06218 [Armillaria ostoyae]|uniref:Uncharacterized protein n=1 Tax=Armillaria ostoyae TaxID=47428 RepID=A0A284R2D0_ARMOS|nr:uncharacterized protein ARMOST_06218 [Armillaria ostoyae]